MNMESGSKNSDSMICETTFNEAIICSVLFDIIYNG